MLVENKQSAESPTQETPIVELPAKMAATVIAITGQVLYLGEIIGTVTTWGTEWKSNFGDQRQSIEVTTDKGTRYIGVWYKSNAQSLARLNKVS